MEDRLKELGIRPKARKIVMQAVEVYFSSALFVNPETPNQCIKNEGIELARKVVKQGM